LKHQWVRPDIDNRIKAGSIAARFNTCVVEIKPGSVVVESVAEGLQASGREEIPAEQVFLLTGYKPDVELMRRAGVTCQNETLAPELDPETFETNVPNLFIAGGASAGRKAGPYASMRTAPTIDDRLIRILSADERV
jgi:thioredoxin reductase (NADPH)